MKRLLFVLPLLVAPAAWGRTAILAPREYVSVISDAMKGMSIDGGWTIQAVPEAIWKGPGATMFGHAPYAFTDLHSGVTYLNEGVLRLSPYVIRRILAHEMGHLTLGTTDETKANRWADAFLQRYTAVSVR